MPTLTIAVGWQSIGPEGGRIDGFAQAPTDPDRFYCLPYHQGVFRSYDHGETWSRVDGGLPSTAPYQRVAVSWKTEDLLLVGDPANDRVQRSTDAGVTWTPVPIASGWSAMNAIAFDPIDRDRVLVALFGGTKPGIHRSTDGGQTWALSNTGIAPLNSIAFHPQIAGVVLASNVDGIYRSTDGGASWTQVSTPAASWVTSISYCASVPSRVWASGPGRVLRSDDGGASFAASGLPPQGDDFTVEGVAAHLTDPNLVVGALVQWSCNADCFARVHSVIRSTDGGSTWPGVAYPLHDGFEDTSVTEIVFDRSQPSTAYLAATSPSESGLLRSENSGASWTRWMNGLYGNPILAIGRDMSGAVYARRQGFNGVWRADTIGGPWTSAFRNALVPGSAAECFEVTRGAEGLLHEGSLSISSFDSCSPTYSQSIDGGQVWWVNGTLPQMGQIAFTALVVSNHGDGGTFYAWVDNTPFAWTLHRSDNGFSFTTSHPAFPTAAAVLDPIDPMRLFAANRQTGEVKLTTDGGATWMSRSIGLPTSTPVGLFMDPATPARLAVVYRTAGTFRSEDAGISWSQIPLGVGPMTVVAADWDPAANRFAFATQSQGVFLSDHGLVTAGLPTFNLTSILFAPTSGHVVLGTADASVLAFDLSDPTSSPVTPLAPHDLVLMGHPNPSRSVVQFDVVAPTGGHAELAIYTVAGRRVVTLATGIDGTRTFTWKGSNVAGQRVAPGVYFARLTSGSESRIQRVVLLDR